MGQKMRLVHVLITLTSIEGLAESGYSQTRLSLRCSHTPSMDKDGDSEKSDLLDTSAWMLNGGFCAYAISTKISCWLIRCGDSLEESQSSPQQMISRSNKKKYISRAIIYIAVP